MPFKVVKHDRKSQGVKEIVTAFPERWEAEEFTRAQNSKTTEPDKFLYSVEEYYGDEKLPRPHAVRIMHSDQGLSRNSQKTQVDPTPILKIEFPTVRELIREAINEAGGRATLSQIYLKVKEYHRDSSQHSIRGILSVAVRHGEFLRHPDHTYTVGPGPTRFPKLVRGLMHGLENSGRGQLFPSGAIFDGKLFYPVDFSEHDLEVMMIQNARSIFGRDTLYIPKKKLIGAHVKKVTDGLLLDLNNPKDPTFWIVEVELSSHPAGHIETQLSGFKRGLRQPRTLRELLKAVWDYVKESKDIGDWYSKSFTPALQGRDPHEFIDDLVHKSSGVIVVINQLTPSHREVISDLSERRKMKVIEFKTYTSQGLLIHTFSQPKREPEPSL